MRSPGRSRRRAWGAMLLAWGMCSCAPPPRVIVDAGAAPASSTSAPQVTDGRRALAPAEATAVVRKIEEPARSDVLARHLALVESHVQEPLLTGNRARLLIDGPQTHEAMFAAIETAQHSIELETYILESGAVGERLAAALVRKRIQGVRIRVLYDAVGSVKTESSYFDRLKAQDIGLCAFNPIKPTDANKDLTLNNRDHRKILVVDRRVAFTGGVNISGVYASGSFGSSRRAPADDPKDDGWRDTHIELRGPVVDSLLKLFDDAWSKQRCEGPGPGRALPPPRPAGDEVMRVIAQDPQADRNEFYVEMLSAIGHAEEHAWLTFGYFVPDPQTVAALKAAARRGVDVRILVPGQSDIWLTLFAGRSHYADLLEAGVRIFERQDAVLHAKTAVVDGVWSTIGSSNLDWRSFVHNFEVNVVILGPGMAKQLRTLFERDLGASKEITREAWTRRGLGSRLKEAFSRLWEYFL